MGDFDGDGLQDVAVTALADATLAENAGTVHIFAPVEGVVAPDGVSSDGDALRGDTADAYFGYQVRNATDIDGDGAEELLISELYAESSYGRVWLMGGARSFGGAALSDAALTAWIGEQADALTGNSIAVGDLDNDGLMDFVVAAYGFISSGTSANGKVYVVLSGG